MSENDGRGYSANEPLPKRGAGSRAMRGLAFVFFMVVLLALGFGLVVADVYLVAWAFEVGPWLGMPLLIVEAVVGVYCYVTTVAPRRPGR